MNTQAFRNFMFSCGYAADSAMELWFRNSKGTKEESAVLRKGTIHDSLSRLFVFTTIRVAKVANELNNLTKQGKFMDCEVPKPQTYRKSTYFRWNDQVRRVYTILCSLCLKDFPDCTHSKLHTETQCWPFSCCTRASKRLHSCTHVGTIN